jgi:hypothetical protein
MYSIGLAITAVILGRSGFSGCSGSWSFWLLWSFRVFFVHSDFPVILVVANKKEIKYGTMQITTHCLLLKEQPIHFAALGRNRNMFFVTRKCHVQTTNKPRPSLPETTG